MMQVPHEAVWFASAMMIVGAVIDGWKRKVPNALTFPLAAAGLAYHAVAGGGPGVVLALEGLAVGLLVLLPVYAIGGMGAGDVKLMASVGAWVGPALTLGGFVCGVYVGAAMALMMVAWSGRWRHHAGMFLHITHEIVAVRDPVALSGLAAARKPTMALLPYGVPLTIGSLGYFAWAGALF